MHFQHAFKRTQKFFQVPAPAAIPSYISCHSGIFTFFYKRRRRRRLPTFNLPVPFDLVTTFISSCRQGRERNGEMNVSLQYLYLGRRHAPLSKYFLRTSSWICISKTPQTKANHCFLVGHPLRKIGQVVKNKNKQACIRFGSKKILFLFSSFFDFSSVYNTAISFLAFRELFLED